MDLVRDIKKIRQKMINKFGALPYDLIETLTDIEGWVKEQYGRKKDK